MNLMLVPFWQEFVLSEESALFSSVVKYMLGFTSLKISQTLVYLSAKDRQQLQAVLSLQYLLLVALVKKNFTYSTNKEEFLVLTL